MIEGQPGPQVQPAVRNEGRLITISQANGAVRSLKRVWYEECCPPAGGSPSIDDLKDVGRQFAKEILPELDTVYRKANLLDHISNFLRAETDPRTYGGAVRRVFLGLANQAERSVSFVADALCSTEACVSKSWGSLKELLSDSLRPSLSNLLEYVLWDNGSVRSDALPMSTRDSALDWVHQHCRYNMV